MHKINLNGFVEMAHGSGGRAMSQLIDELFVRAFDNPELNNKSDAALLKPLTGELVMTTDSHVISPLVFPGGDIGSLSVNGTINDVAMAGGIPHYLTCGFILEEGFPLKDLQAIIYSMAQAARNADVRIVAGDTKVVERGKADGVFITTTGLGPKHHKANLSANNINIGDKIIINGGIGDHGISILSQRQNLGFHSSLVSDCAPLHTLTKQLLDAFGSDIHCMRDPTRGGVAATLNELAQQSKLGICLDQTVLPIKPEVHAACELLGLDPLTIANEGKFIAFCSAHVANSALELLQQHPLGENAAIIGNVVADDRYLVELATPYGGKRIIDWLYSDQLPRIC